MLEAVLQWFFLNLSTHVLNQNPFLSYFSSIALKWVIWILYLKIEIITVIHYSCKFVWVCSERKVNVDSHFVHMICYRQPWPIGRFQSGRCNPKHQSHQWSW
jgi:hypothetical protein